MRCPNHAGTEALKGTRMGDVTQVLHHWSQDLQQDGLEKVMIPGTLE